MADPIFEPFSVTVDPRPLVVANCFRPGGPDLQYQVTYQVANPAALGQDARNLLSRHGVPLDDPQAMHRHLRRLLDAREAPPQHPALNGHLHPAYRQLHHDAVRRMSDHDRPYQALRAWADTESAYCVRLNTSLCRYALTGDATLLRNDEPCGSDEQDRLDQFNALDEELDILAGLMQLPECRTDTLRRTHGPQSTRHPYTGELAIAGAMVPGDIVSNYPAPMSTTSSGDLEQFGGFRSYAETRVSRFIGRTGRPLLELSDAEEEREILFSARESFQIVAVAYAQAERLPQRVAALYVEVQGVDPAQVPNLHTGQRPRYHLQPILPDTLGSLRSA